MGGESHSSHVVVEKEDRRTKVQTPGGEENDATLRMECWAQALIDVESRAGPGTECGTPGDMSTSTDSPQRVRDVVISTGTAVGSGGGSKTGGKRESSRTS